MKSISELLNKAPPKIILIEKKLCISKIAQLVKYNNDPLTNWKIISRRLKYASVSDTNKILISIQQGTIEYSKDYKGAFEHMMKRLPKIKKPKQQKLL